MKILSVVLNALALGMGVSSLVLSILGSSVNTSLLLSIGLSCLGIYGLDRLDKK